MYSIIYSQQARKQIKSLNRDIQVKIISTIERIRINPYNHVKKLVGNDCFSLRIGKYRVILDVKKGDLLILVVEVGHRKNTYK